MENEKFRIMINQMIDDKLNSMTNMAVPNHYHNSWDSNQLDPAVALLGFPVILVTDARVAPTDIPTNGIFRFLIDTTPRYYFWAYLNYFDNTTSSLVGAWKSVALT